MIVLNIETATDACSVAITCDGKVVETKGERLERLTPAHSEHAREVAVMADELLRLLREAGQHIDAVAVSEGPGSYTGLRIGASIAKGLAYGMNVPLYAIPTLQAMAVEKEADEWLCPMIDARRMEVYTCLFNEQGEEILPVQAKVIDETSFADVLEQHKVVFYGNGSEKCESVLAHPHARFIKGVVPSAAAMGARLAQILASKPDYKSVDVAYWTPFYLKEFEAKKSVVKGLD